MSRPVVLEVCSGEGGSTRGLMNAGWDVIAVDDNPSRLKRNPARWTQQGLFLSIPPAYTHFIGEQLIERLEVAA